MNLFSFSSLITIPLISSPIVYLAGRLGSRETIKTIMRGLGLPSGPCRAPLGRMTPKGVEVIRRALREVHGKNLEIFRPLEEFYTVKMEDRISDDKYWK